MTIMEAIQARHSVRQYLNKPLTDDVISALRAEIDVCNAESGLHIQLVTNEPKAFDSIKIVRKQEISFFILALVPFLAFTLIGCHSELRASRQFMRQRKIFLFNVADVHHVSVRRRLLLAATENGKPASGKVNVAVLPPGLALLTSVLEGCVEAAQLLQLGFCVAVFTGKTTGEPMTSLQRYNTHI